MLDKLNVNTNWLKKALDGTWLRHNVISHNITNADTPNYKKSTVEFEQKLKEAMNENKGKLKTTNKKHIPHIDYSNNYDPEIIKHNNYSYRFDGNNVNIDTEQTELAKNTIMYDALVRSITDEYEKIKNVISEGSK